MTEATADQKRRIENKVKVDTGLQISLKNSWLNPGFAKEVLATDRPFVVVDGENFYIGEGEEVLNPGQVFIDGRRDLALTVRPFRALQRGWTPESGFFHHR